MYTRLKFGEIWRRRQKIFSK